MKKANVENSLEIINGAIAEVEGLAATMADLTSYREDVGWQSIDYLTRRLDEHIREIKNEADYLRLFLEIPKTDTPEPTTKTQKH